MAVSGESSGCQQTTLLREAEIRPAVWPGGTGRRVHTRRGPSRAPPFRHTLLQIATRGNAMILPAEFATLASRSRCQQIVSTGYNSYRSRWHDPCSLGKPMNTAIPRLVLTRPGLGLLKNVPKVRTLGAWLPPEPPKPQPQRPAMGTGVTIFSVAVLVALGCVHRPVSPRRDADGGSDCTTAGCSAPPLCSEGCRAPCGCCSCSPGVRSGDLVCTDHGCYAPAPTGAPDAATGAPDVATAVPDTATAVPDVATGAPDAATGAPDAGAAVFNCAMAGCSSPPLCSEGCRAPCGCCSCSPGVRSGDLVCTDQLCYAPAPAPAPPAPDAGILVGCSGEGDPLCGKGSSCIEGCPDKGGGGLCSVVGRETCGCGAIVYQPCTTPGLQCLYPSCCDFQGLCLTPAERQAVCSGPLAAKFNCTSAVGSPDAGSDGPGRTDAASNAGWTPAPACALPFDVGSCEAVVPVYAFVNGACAAKSWGGCGGNANRFSTLEECMATCEGRPSPFGCPSGRTAQKICLACGAAGGCALSMVVCALPCDPASTTSCMGGRYLGSCVAGVCQDAYCE